MPLLMMTIILKWFWMPITINAAVIISSLMLTAPNGKRNWQTKGVKVSIILPEIGRFRAFFEVTGDGEDALFSNPHSAGDSAAVTWRLSRHPGDSRTGIRLYFSPTGSAPMADQIREVLGSHLTAVLGVPELLGGRPVRVGPRNTEVHTGLVNPEVLPRLDD